MGPRQARNLFNQFDARIVAQQQHAYPPAGPKLRGAVKNEVRGCKLCNLSKDHAPVPFSTAPRAEFAVVGEAPGPEEDKRGEPFVGPSGRLLRTFLSEANLDPYNVTYINTVSCFPSNEGKVRAPSREETGACRANLMVQLHAADVKYVLLVGGKALDAFRSDITISDAHGKIMLWMDRWVVMGIFHPAAVLRGRRDYKVPIGEDLARWADIIDHQAGINACLGEVCVKCDQPAVEWDRDCAPWCQRHWEMWQNQWEKERRRWDLTTVQLTL